MVENLMKSSFRFQSRRRIYDVHAASLDDAVYVSSTARPGRVWNVVMGNKVYLQHNNTARNLAREDWVDIASTVEIPFVQLKW